MEQLLSSETWNDFRKLLNMEKTFCSCTDYYSALVGWIKDNTEIFDISILQNNRIIELLDLDPEKYIIDNPNISLDMEPVRMFNSKPSTLDSFMMCISTTLWELVSISSDTECPYCIYAELKYMIFESNLTKKRELVLECEECGYAELINGKGWNKGTANVFPANKKDLEKFGVKISSSST